MRQIRLLIISILLVSFMGAADVFAGLHDHHHGGHEQAVASPFEKKQEGNSLHCLLKNHQHKGDYCPHSALPTGKDSTHRLSVDCGGKTPGAIPSFSFHKDNIDNSSSIPGSTNLSLKLMDEVFLGIQQDLSSQDPPPEVL